MPYSKLELKVRRLERIHTFEAAETQYHYNKWVFAQQRARAAFDKLTVAKNELEEERESLAEVQP